MNEEKKAELRAKNEQALKGKRPDASFFKSLDSSIKKNSAFVKKIKTLSELQPDQKGSLLPDVSFITEMYDHHSDELIHNYFICGFYKLQSIDAIIGFCRFKN